MSTENISNTLNEKLFDPRLGEDFKVVKSVDITDDQIRVAIELPYPAESETTVWESRIKELVNVNQSIKVDIHTAVKQREVPHWLKPLAGVKNIIVVSSGKGGVGKSTTAANLALALSAEGSRVGIMDADIYGPSQGLVFGVNDKLRSSDGYKVDPVESLGIQVVSIAMLLDGDSNPMAWRGPMAATAMEQLIRDANWRDLDYLVIDMPPGTGDIPIQLARKIPVTGAVIVTTPQDVALIDVKKGVAMFENLSVPILGVVENMAAHVCTNCGHIEHIFGEGGGEEISKQFNTKFLGSLPLNKKIREETDSGKPTVYTNPDSSVSLIYRNIAKDVAAQTALFKEQEKPRFGW